MFQLFFSASALCVTLFLAAPLPSFAHTTVETHSDDPAEEPQVVLTLDEALALTFENSPRLKISGLSVAKAEAEVTQAAVAPNPEVSYETENFNGSGPYRGGDLREDTVSVSQRLEIGGKRGDRIRIAETNLSATRIETELTRSATASEVVSRFINALANQLRLQNAENIFRLTQDLATAAIARVEAGKEPPFHSMNANAALFAAKADYEKAKNEFILSRRRLAALWGAPKLRFHRLSGAIESFARPPDQDEVMQKIADYPQARRYALIIAHAEASAELEAGKRWPDITLSVGQRTLKEVDARAYVAGVAMEIPLFNRNQGAYRAAEIQALQAEEISRRADLEFRLEVESALGNLWTAFHELESFRQAGLSAVAEAMKAATEGYREGKLSYVAALNARQALADAQSRYIDTLERYHALRARLDELTGMDVKQAGAWLLQGRAE